VGHRRGSDLVGAEHHLFRRCRNGRAIAPPPTPLTSRTSSRPPRCAAPDGARAETDLGSTKGTRMRTPDPVLGAGAWLLENGHRSLLKLTGGPLPQIDRGDGPLKSIVIQPFQDIRPPVDHPTAALDELRASPPVTTLGERRRRVRDTRLLRWASPVGGVAAKAPNGRGFRQTGPGARRRTARWSAGVDR
jgi:hypothetical protein